MTTSIRHRNTAKVKLQSCLTGMGHSKRLPLVGRQQAREDLFRAFSRDNLAKFFHASSLNICDAPKFLQQFLCRPRPDAGDVAQPAVGLPLPAALTMKSHSEAVGLVANLLNQVEHRRMTLQHDGLVFLT